MSKRAIPSPLGGPVDDHRGFDHVLEVADAAVVAVLLPLGRLVLKVFAEVAEGPGHLYLLNELGAEDLDPVLELLFHLVDVHLGQFVVHNSRLF